MPQLELYGGALSAELPGEWFDASDVRPVPDHQEVWLEKAGPERSFVLELLEALDGADDETAAREHFAELASMNEALGFEVLSAGGVADGAPVCATHGPLPTCILTGTQSLPRDVQLHVTLALVRLRAHKTDVLFSVCRPVTQTAAAQPAEDRRLLATLLNTFKVVDWSLFGT